MQYLLHQSIDKATSRFPDREAFVCVNQRISYAELSKKTDQLAGLLASRGVRKGDRVGIYMNRSIETALALYGILKAGAAYVPLDPDAPQDRIHRLIDTCGINSLVTNQAQKKDIQTLMTDVPAELNCIIGIRGEWPIETFSWEQVFALTATRPQVEMCDQDLAYIIFTSGSTGTPKGIMHTHRSGLAYARLTADLYQLTEEDRFGNHCPLHFDISTLGYLTAPFVGATTVIVSDAHTKLPVSLAQLISKEKVTIWYSVTLALTQMLQSGVLSDLPVPKLKWVLFAGEPFPAKNLRQLMTLWPQCIYSNVYGPAEVNQCTFYNVKGTLPDGPVSLGRTWNNTQGLIVDDHGQEVVPGETGELLIRSATMMYGYWQQPELTQKSLYKKASTAGIEEVYYRTGDLVKMEPDGNMTFLGRKDTQVKVRGYRVELTEVSDNILSHNQVEEAGAVAKSTAEGPMVIIAYVVKKQGSDLEEKALRSFLSDRLPAYARPAVINWLEALPRTSANKIDHRKLTALANDITND